MDFVFFDDVSSSYPAFALPCLEHLHGRQHSSQCPCYRRPGPRFAVRENSQQAMVDFSILFLFKRLPSQDTKAFSHSFYRTELGLPLFHFLFLRSNRLAPYCFSTFLAGTHNYLAGTYNYFFTIRTMTTVHHGLPLGGWYCTISFFFLSALPTQMAPSGLPRTSIMPSLAPRAECVEIFKWSPLSLHFVFLLFE